MTKPNRQRYRLLALCVVIWLVLGLFILRLAQLQIVEGSSYLAQLERGTSTTQVIKAARGEIFDRQGRPFTYNEVKYTILFDRALAPSGSPNETILKLIEILRASGEAWIDSLPLATTAPFGFTDDETEISRLKSKNYLNLNSYASAEETFHWLRDRYDLLEMNDADARAVAGVRYEMEKKGYGYDYAVRYTFAEGVSVETAVLIRQSGRTLPGIDVVEAAQRSYVDGGLAPHIIGRVGPIFADELEDYLSRDRGYSRDDTVGKEGIERTFEDTLRGHDGVRRIDLNAQRRVIGVEVERPALPGNSIVLTIDKDIQRAASEALWAQIDLLNRTAPAGQGREANAGAVVAIDVKRSEVLCAVTFPSYDLSSYSTDYALNAANPLHPFLNRAFSGVYAPGSCFKPVTATAGLAEGVVTPETHVTCQRVYSFYPSYQPTCLGYHGAFTVVDALRHSCNVYFYDTGRKLGIERLNYYASALGLGVPTGIELLESSGTLNDPNTVNPGDALQAAIGQLDNGFTPVQLANYAATIARRGQRYNLSLIKSISSYYDPDEVLEAHTPELAQRLDVEPFVFDTVIEGMVQASHNPRGTAYRYLGDYPYTVASKTGTPQTWEFPNSTFICFAPAEDPQIAIAVVIEKGWHGYTGAPVARAVFDAFFFPETLEPPAEEESASSVTEPGSEEAVSSSEAGLAAE